MDNEKITTANKWEPVPHDPLCKVNYLPRGQSCSCSGVRDFSCRRIGDTDGLWALCNWFGRLQVPVAARSYYDGWHYRDLPDDEYPLVCIEEPLYTFPERNHVL